MNRHGERMALFHNRVFMVCLLLAALLCPGPRPAAAVTEPAAGKVTREASYGALPLLFIPNEGQYDPRVAYAVQGRDKSIFFTNEGLTFVLSEPADSPPAGKPRALRDLAPHEPGPPMPQQRWTVKLDFVDANPGARPESLEQAGTVISYFKGQPAEWRTGLQASRKIIYRDLWPGIDLIYSGTVHRLKYDFIVHPGADPARIRLACRGADGVAVTPSGQLELTTPLGTLRDEMPKAWQERDGKRENVAVAYALNGPVGVQVAALASDQGGAVTLSGVDSNQKQQVYGFTVGDFDHARTLILDPEILVYCGFLGGSGDDYGSAIAINSAGNAYVTGSTTSTGAPFPVKAGSLDESHNGGPWDAFVAKVKADGTDLVYCSFLGGSGNDYGNGIAVDNDGNAYITGGTASVDLPVTSGSLDESYNGNVDGFVAKVKADGTVLEYCGFLGGSGDDYGYSIALDAADNAYLTGGTISANFPTTPGFFGSSHNGNTDAFVAKINPTGSALIYSGFLGGSAEENGFGIAVGSDGSAYVTGYTNSTADTFPETVGPYLTHHGDSDAFVAKVKVDGTVLEYCGFLGGSGEDGGNAITVDSTGSAYVTGFTSSTQTTFPAIIGPDLVQNGGTDAFVAKVMPDGTGLDYCGFLGGSGADSGYSIVVDNTGSAYVAGYTNSTQATFPVLVGPDLSQNGDADAFVAKVRAGGMRLDSSGFLGGSGEDIGWGLAVDKKGDVYVVGGTQSTTPSFPARVGPFLIQNGGRDVFIAKLTEEFPWEIFLPAILGGANKK